MDYTEVTFTIDPLIPFREIVVAELSELGFESFVDTEEGVQAYVSFSDFQGTNLQALAVLKLPETTISFSVKQIPAQNWNATWESNFDPIAVKDQCRVRAPFHAAEPPVLYDVLISPKMSFGTGHHETTWLMMATMLEMELENKTVLDMGCGTGVLAILAEKMGAKSIAAIDIDEWAYNNSLENIQLNETVNITVQKGGVDVLQTNRFNIILANINKNVLLSDLAAYNEALAPQGHLLMSGFFVVDVEEIRTTAVALGLTFVGQSDKNGWSTALFAKKS
jgi:ribosomal protein L11 methyltransferase